MFSTSFNAGSAYSPLRDKDSDEDGTEENPSRRAPTGIMLPAFVAVATLCVLINTLLLSLLYFSLRPASYPTEQNIQLLKAPSVYIGLDRLYASTPASKKYPPIRNQAQRFFHTSSLHPTVQVTVEPPKKLLPEGSVPSARGFYQLLLSPQITTFVEFRTIDYGMENCNLVLDIPTRNDTDHWQTIVASEGTLEIWAVGEFNTRINRDTLSWNTRPKRTELLGSAPIHYGALQTFPEFRCPSGLYLTYELACKDCRFNFTRFSDKVHDVFYLSQTQSLP